MKFIELVLFEMNFIKNRHTTQIKILFHSINLYDSSRYKFFLTFAKKKEIFRSTTSKNKKEKKNSSSFFSPPNSIADASELMIIIILVMCR